MPSKNLVITMCNKDYFKFGELFLLTRNKINADFILCGPDLDDVQIKILNKNNIGYVKIDQNEFDLRMQAMKFNLIIDNCKGYDNITLLDFDMFFLNDWHKLFSNEFDFGITVREPYIKKQILRAYSNGGAMFIKGKKGINFCKFALDVIKNGGDSRLPEYDLIFKTLEEHDNPKKRQSRHIHRWWVDQVFLSAIILNCGITSVKYQTFKKFGKYMIAFLNCDYYNVLDISPKPDSYIVHLKDAGREDMNRFRKLIK